jgi:hypothetical protein
VLLSLWRLHQRGATIPPLVRISGVNLALNHVAVHVVYDDGVGMLQVAPDIEALLDEGDTLDIILTHEVGHHAHLLHVGYDRYIALSQRLFTPAEQRVFSSAPCAEFRWWLRMVDNTDPCEFVAETFRLLSDGGDVPNTLRRLYRQLGGPAPLRRKED